MERTRLEWRGEANTVKIAGDFTQWEELDLVREGEGVWGIELSLAPASYKYNFVVDGERAVNSDDVTQVDGEGNTVNVVEVVKEGSDVMEVVKVSDDVDIMETSSDSDSWEIVQKEEDESVVERLYLVGEDTEARLAGVGAVQEENVSYVHVYYDTEDLLLNRRGTWLRKRAEQGLWQIRHLNEEGKMVEIDNIEDVASCLGEELGEAGGVEEVVKDRLGEVHRSVGRLVRYRLGEMSLVLVTEGGVGTACVRLVGDVLACLKDLENWAQKLQLKAFDMTEQAGGMGQ